MDNEKFVNNPAQKTNSLPSRQEQEEAKREMGMNDTSHLPQHPYYQQLDNRTGNKPHEPRVR